jgi:hypothetical protein
MDVFSITLLSKKQLKNIKNTISIKRIVSDFDKEIRKIKGENNGKK